MVATARRRGHSTILDVGRVVLTASTLATAFGAVLLVVNIRNRQGLPSVGAALALALSATVAAIAIRLAAKRLDSRLAHWERRAVLLLPTPVLLMLALTAPGAATPIAATLLIWAVFVGEEIWWWLRGKHAPEEFNADAGDAELRLSEATGANALIADAETEADDEMESVLPAGHWQQYSRRRENGQECIEVLARAEFAVGQQQTTLHLAFCPPLESDPNCECHQLEGPEAVMKLTQAEPYGARLDLRLQRRPESAIDVVICLTALADAASPGD